MILLKHKLFRVVLFVLLVNINYVLKLEIPPIITLIIQFIIGFIVVYYFVPIWNKYDKENKKE